METFTPRGNIYGPILPQFILEKRITFGAKIMYALLCNYASEKDHCWPSQATLAERLSCSVSSVKNYLGELVRAKLIDVRHEQYRSSVYYMMRPNELEERQPKAVHSQPDSACPQPNSGYLNNLSKQRKEKNPPLPPTEPETPKAFPAATAPAAGGVSVSLFDFEAAWELYPKKEAKGLARAAWISLLRSGQLPLLVEIQTSIRRFMTSESWLREQGRFVPHMGNWLRGQRWLDSLPAPVKEPQPGPPRMDAPCRAHLEREEALKRKRQEERERLRPAFDAFAATFRAKGQLFNEPMAFGMWLFQHSKQCAPLASDVPEDNTLEIIAFLTAHKRKSDEARFKATRSVPIRTTDSGKRQTSGFSFTDCGNFPRNPGFVPQFFSEGAALCAAV